MCRPKLTVRNVQLSSTHPETMQRKWTATVMADATQCAPNSSGYFDLVVSRAKENAVEFEFRERFIWLSSSVEIGLDLWADEAVDAYWIDQATPCACAN